MNRSVYMAFAFVSLFCHFTTSVNAQFFRRLSRCNTEYYNNKQCMGYLRGSSGDIITITLPLCPKIASVSYNSADEGKGKLINRFVADEAKRRGIEIHPLSYFIAEFKGPRSEVEWLKRNYASMLCGFNPELVVNDEATYTSCITHAVEWIKLIDEGRMNELMLDKYLYCPNCCTPPSNKK